MNNMRKLALRQRKPVVGFGVCLGSVRSAEMAGETAFDYIMVDMLHSHFEKDDATSAIRSLAKGNGPIPFARVANNMDSDINSMLDAGAMGIIVPMVQDRESAERAVQSCFYSPIGLRSKGSPAAVFYGSDYYKKNNELVDLIVMIETPEAAEKADAILSVSHLSGCLIGAGDLSYILSQRGKSEQLKDIVRHIIQAAHKNGIAVGISVSHPEDLVAWWKEGMDFYLVSHDMGVLHEGIKKHEQLYMSLKVQER